MGDSNQLFESLFRPKIGEAGDVAFLKQLTTDHPYFSPAQFYLLERTNENDPDYAEQAAKTALLFNNHFWLNFQLQEARDKRIASNDSKDLATEEPIIRLENEVHETVQPSETSPGSITILDDQVEVEPNEADKPGGDLDELEIERAVAKNGEEPAEINGNRPAYGNTENANDRVVDRPGREEGSFVEDYPEAVVGLEPVTGETETLQQDQSESPAVTGKLPESIRPSNEEAGDAMDAEEGEIDPEEQKELAPLNVKLNFQEPIPTNDTLTFEPLHTTDYFASQGIRLSNEIQSTDKLAKQLKSFTEWLKTMKKVHTEQPSDNINQTDVSIQKLAEKSNAEDEVVTEAMADVLIQQGKGSKAREVYRKLSLLNPTKTAYFAAKIDQLKEQ